MSIYADSCLGDIVELWWTHVLLSKQLCESFDITAFLASSILSSSKLHTFLFFVWLVNLPRIWYKVSPWIMFGFCWSTNPMYSVLVNAPLLSRFSECLVKKAVFVEKPGCTFSGASRERGTTDQILLWSGRCSCSRSPFALIVTHFAWNFPELSGVSLFLIFFQNHGVGCGNLSTILNFVCARIYPNQYPSFVRTWHFHFQCEHPSLSKIFFWSDEFFCLFFTFALSTTACVVSSFGLGQRLPSAARGLSANRSLSTADARACRFSSAIKSIIWGIVSCRTIEAVFCWLSRSSSLIFPRQSQMPQRIQMSLAELMRPSF